MNDFTYGRQSVERRLLDCGHLPDGVTFGGHGLNCASVYSQISLLICRRIPEFTIRLFNVRVVATMGASSVQLTVLHDGEKMWTNSPGPSGGKRV